MSIDKKNQTPINTKPGGISTKGYKKPKAPKVASIAPTPVRVGMSAKKKKTIFAIIAAALVLVIAVTSVIVGVSVYNKNFDYIEYDLSRYVKFSGGSYKDYPMSLPIAKPHVKDEGGEGISDVEMAILDLIYREKYEKASPIDSGEYTGGVVALGDRVRLRYRAYVLGSDGFATAPTS